MTEEEAKMKWCPMARVFVADGVGAANRGLPGIDAGPGGEKVEDLSANCLGSRCMVWCAGHKTGHGSCGLSRP